MKQQRDEEFMRIALDCAIVGWRTAKKPFGAVIVDTERPDAPIEYAGSADLWHPEVLAIRHAVIRFGTNLSRFTIYSNFEPCAGCAAVIRDYAVGRVVYAMCSPHWGGSARWPILHEPIEADYTAAGIDCVPDVVPGVLINEAEKLFDEIGWTMHKKELAW